MDSEYRDPVAPLVRGESAVEQTGGDTDAANRRNMALLVQLRWIAVAGQVATILVVELWLKIPLPLVEMAVVLAALVGLNLVTQVWMREERQVSARALPPSMQAAAISRRTSTSKDVAARKARVTTSALTSSRSIRSSRAASRARSEVRGYSVAPKWTSRRSSSLSGG